MQRTIHRCAWLSMLCLLIVATTTVAQDKPISATDKAALKGAGKQKVSVTGTVKLVQEGAGGDGQIAFLLYFSEDQSGFFLAVLEKDAKEVFRATGDAKKLVGTTVIAHGTVADNGTGTFVMVLAKAGDLETVAKKDPKAPVRPNPRVVGIDAKETAEIMKRVNQKATITGELDRVNQTAQYMFLMFKQGQAGFHIIVDRKHIEAVFKNLGPAAALEGKTIAVVGTIGTNIATQPATPMMRLETADQIRIVNRNAAPNPAAPEGSDKNAAPKTNTVEIPKARVGSFRMRFEGMGKSSTLSKLASMLKRKGDVNGPYDLANESYQVNVPRDYKPGLPHGLLVFIDHFDSPSVDGTWTPVLDKRHFIWLSPSKAGTRAPIARRLALAIDATRHLRKTYSIDPDRVYISGRGTGGIAASVAVMSLPDIFKGAIISSTAYYRDITFKSDNKNYIVGKSELFGYPPSRALSLAKRSARVVIAFPPGGTNNNLNSAVYNKGWKADGFRYLYQPPNAVLSNSAPNSKTLEIAIQFMDTPLTRTASSYFKKGKTFDRTKNVGKAYDAYGLAAMRGADSANAKKAMERVNALYPDLMKTLATRENDINAIIESGVFVKAVAEIRKLDTQYGAVADPIIARLNDKYDEAKKGPRKPTTVASNTGFKPGEKKDDEDLEVKKAAAREEARLKREAIAKKQLEDADKLVRKDLVEGYIALRAIEKRHRGTDTGTNAGQKADDLLRENRQSLKPALEERDAEELMKLAKDYVKLKKFEDAYQALRKLVREHPRTTTATEARKLMDEIAKFRNAG